jgi:archaellum component FlaC
MDDSEHDQLSEIHDEVQGSNAALGAIDERTRNIENQLDNISDDVSKNEKDINDIQSKVKRNTTIINAVTVGLGSVLIWVADKLTRFNPF